MPGTYWCLYIQNKVTEYQTKEDLSFSRKKKKKTKTNQTKPKQIISIFEFEAVQDSREQFSSFGKETPSCIPTVTNVSKDLALLARRSSSSLIESCNTCHVKGKVGGADAGTHLGI